MILIMTDLILSTKSSTVLAAIPTSSTYWAHLSALTEGSKYSRIVLLKAERDRFSPWANRRYAKVLLPKLNASNWSDCSSATCQQWLLVSSPVCRSSVSLACALLRLPSLSMDGCAGCGRFLTTG